MFGITQVEEILKSGTIDEQYTIKAWVRSRRGNKNISFISLSDGSCQAQLQTVAENINFEENVLREITTGSAIEVTGTLKKSEGSGQDVELIAEKIKILGTASSEHFPLQKKKHSLEFLREIAHLRPRTNTFGAILRIRHHLSFAIHDFFNSNNFFYLHSPVITGSDAEGAGEMFRVTTFEPNNAPTKEDGSIDYEEDFFGKETNLTVSGQLEAELAALGLSRVYTFGPTFRAENSNTSRHLAEFWMIEPEAAFFELKEDMDLAEQCVKYCINYVKEHCPEELAFLAQRFDEEESAKPAQQRSKLGLMDRINMVLENDFERLSYTEAIDILKNSKPNKKKKFEFLIEDWGADLQSEHEKYLVEKHFEKPVILYNYPKDIKAFYMRLNDDDKTVAAMDVLFPGIGEIIGGSQREERLDVLKSRIAEMEIPEEDVWWYLDTRKYGTVPHSGFGLGLERLLIFITGMSNVRDVIPFPRTPKNAEF